MCRYRNEVEAYLAGCFTDEHCAHAELLRAMRYSLLAGGKRIRPILTLKFCELCGGDRNKALPFAAAVEMIHTYSLIHDDLPCMDNDDYRRGRRTNHKVFGDGMAVLAGDALLTAAFSACTDSEIPPETIVRVIHVLSEAAGESGMVGGQAIDIQGEHRSFEESEICVLHRMKTGAMISAACRIGAIVGGGSESQIQAAGAYAEALGLAFQIRDDMLDVLGNREKMGKAIKMDENKTTFMSLYGKFGCEKQIEQETEHAIAALHEFEDSEFLAQLADLLATRES